MSLTSNTTLLHNHKELLGAFHLAVDVTSELIPLEDCPNEQLASTLHISQVMLTRAQEQALASIELFLAGHWAAFEALSRISLEYSIQVSSLMSDDPRKTLGCYLGNHFQEMKTRQKQMRDIIVTEGDEKALHELDNHHDQMLYRHELASGYAAFCGFKLMQEKKRATAQDKFRALGKAKLYRGLYSVLSSQVHADAESLVDYIVVHCVQRSDEERDIAAQEMYHWMLHFLINLIAAYIEASIRFTKRFSLDNKTLRLEEISQKVSTLEKKYSQNFQQFKRNAIGS